MHAPPRELPTRSIVTRLSWGGLPAPGRRRAEASVVLGAVRGQLRLWPAWEINQTRGRPTRHLGVTSHLDMHAGSGHREGTNSKIRLINPPRLRAPQRQDLTATELVLMRTVCS